MRRTLWLLLLLALPVVAHAQASNVTGYNVQSGTALPAKCNAVPPAPVDVFIKRTSGVNTLHICGDTNNTWKQLATGSGSSNLVTGSGSPEGVATASPGTLYEDTTNGNVWHKDTGAGNTGWVRDSIKLTTEAAISAGLACSPPTLFYSTDGNHYYACTGTNTIKQLPEAGSSLDLTSGYLATEIANASSTGTTVNLLAKINSSGQAVVLGSSDTDGAVGVVVSGAGTTGNAVVVRQGRTLCVADNTVAAGDWLIPGTSTGGRCRSAGASRSTTAQNVGQAITGASAGATFTALFGDFSKGASGGSSSTASGVEATVSSDQTIANSAAATVLYATERSDDGTYHSTSSNTDRFFCVTAGGYFVSATVETDATGSAPVPMVATIYRLNSSDVVQAIVAETGLRTVTTDFTRGNLSGYTRCNAGDYFEVLVYNGSGATRTILAAQANIFQMFKMGN